jgi:predicted RNA binding protein YcfA (HicA-like mRNA interferase family)
VRTLERLGFMQVSQRGSHLKLRRQTPEGTRTVIVKMGAREVPAGTFASILRQAAASRDEFEAMAGGEAP